MNKMEKYNNIMQRITNKDKLLLDKFISDMVNHKFKEHIDGIKITVFDGAEISKPYKPLLVIHSVFPNEYRSYSKQSPLCEIINGEGCYETSKEFPLVLSIKDFK